VHHLHLDLPVRLVKPTAVFQQVFLVVDMERDVP